MLDFQHIIQINDLQDNTLVMMSRSQLWQGLVFRARHPEKFNKALHCQSTETQDNRFVRKVSAGESSFEEQVILTPEIKIETNTVPRRDQIHAESSVIIEEPEPGALFVRFTYRRDLDGEDSQVEVGEYLKSAYVQLDRDAIAMIRLLAESESLTKSLN